MVSEVTDFYNRYNNYGELVCSCVKTAQKDAKTADFDALMMRPSSCYSNIYGTKDWHPTELVYWEAILLFSILCFMP